jgi:hypothetical protein
MSRVLLAAVIIASGSVPFAQEEKKVPKDSARVTLQGCAKGRNFTVGPRSEHGAANLNIEPGRRFRLNGPKKLLESIEKGEGRMVEVTGLIRKADVEPPGGLSVAGGRVRIGGADPRQSPGGVAGNPGYSQPVMDLESSRPLGEPCKV